MTPALLFLLLPMVDGTIINKTTGQPVANQTVSLVRASEKGMQPAGSGKTDANGKFSIAAQGAGDPAQSISMLQVTYKGVGYNKLVPPMAAGAPVEIEVFDTAATPGLVETAQHMILIEPVPGEIRVRETFMMENKTRITYHDPQAGFRFFLPPLAKGKVDVKASSGAQGMPLNRTAREVPGKPGVYSVDFPMKPGETRFDLTWTAPFGTPGEFSTEVLHKEGPARLIVPRGVTVKGDGLKELGTEPSTQAAIFQLPNAKVNFTIEGAGTLSSQGTATSSEGEGDSGGPPIDVIQPKIYDRLYWILGLGFAILAIAFVYFFRASSPK